MVGSDVRDWLMLLRDLGFPIFIAIWFLWRIDAFLTTLMKAQVEQVAILADLKQAVQVLVRKQPRPRNKKR
jgi:hypothetical protein